MFLYFEFKPTSCNRISSNKLYWRNIMFVAILMHILRGIFIRSNFLSSFNESFDYFLEKEISEISSSFIFRSHCFFPFNAIENKNKFSFFRWSRNTFICRLRLAENEKKISMPITLVSQYLSWFITLLWRKGKVTKHWKVH